MNKTYILALNDKTTYNEDIEIFFDYLHDLNFSKSSDTIIILYTEQLKTKINYDDFDYLKCIEFNEIQLNELDEYIENLLMLESPNIEIITSNIDEYYILQECKIIDISDL